MATRQQNEKAFVQWKELLTGGRLYTRKIPGRTGGYALYCKETDADEKTVRFWQEIYDHNGKLVAKHDKFPLDLGHKSV